MSTLKAAKIKFILLQQSIKSVFPSFLWFLGFLSLLLFGVLANWIYETEEGIIATVQSFSMRQGYGVSGYLVHVSYEQDSDYSSTVIGLPYNIAIKKGEKIVINKHSRFIFRDKYSFSRKIRNNK